MGNAVQFERESNRIRVKHVLSAVGIHGIELRTVLEALDVSKKRCLVLLLLNFSGAQYGFMLLSLMRVLSAN